MRQRLPGAGATHAPAVGRLVARMHCMQYGFCGVGAGAEAAGDGGGGGGGEGGARAGVRAAAAVGATIHVSQVPQKYRRQAHLQRGIKRPRWQWGRRV